MRLTPSAIRGLTVPADKREATFFDDEIPGFGVRLRAGGAARFVVMYGPARNRKRAVLGSPSALDLGAARKMAKDLLAKIRLGHDPASEKAASRLAAGETFGALMPQFLERQRLLLRPRSLTEVVRHLEVHSRPLHALPITEVNRRAVAKLVNNIAVTSGRTAARHVHGSISAYAAWCVAQGYIEHNFAAGIDKEALRAKPRDRVLLDTEIRVIWLALDDSRYGAILKLLLLTALRRSEIGNLSWGEFDPDAATISIPPTRSKSGRVHVVPLSPPALAILMELRQERTSDMVFGADGRGFQDWYQAKQKLDARIEAMSGAAIRDWRHHDFRRSFSTVAHEHGWSPLAIEEALGHVTPGSQVSRVYNKSSHLGERRRLLEWWADRLAAIVEGRAMPDNVVRMK